MESTYIVVIIIFLLVMVLGICICILVFRKQKQKWLDYAEMRYSQGKDESTDFVRRTIESVHLDKERYSSMQEKELLVEVMMTLGGHARRLDRMEDKLGSIINFKEYMDGINDQINTVKKNTEQLKELIQKATKEAEIVQDSSEQMTNSILLFNQKLDMAENVKIKVNSIASDLEKISNVLIETTNRINVLAASSQKMIEVIGDGPIQKIGVIQKDISNLDRLMGSMKTTIGDIQGNVCYEVAARIKESEMRILNSNDELKGEFDSWSYDSMRQNVDDIKGRVDDMKDMIDDMKSTVDRALSQYGYDSLYSKIEEVKNN